MNEKVKQALDLQKAKNLLDIVEVSMHDYAKDNFTTADNIAIKGIREELAKAEDYEIQNKILKEHEKELIAEQHRLFDLAKEQEEALKIIVDKMIDMHDLMYVNFVKNYNNKTHYCGVENLTEAEFDLVKKVVEKYGKKED